MTLLAVCAAVLPGCATPGGRPAEDPPPGPLPATSGEEWSGDPTGSGISAGPIAAPPEEAWADRVLAGLDLRAKAAQLMMPWVLGDFSPEGSPGEERIRRLVEEFGVGGVIVSVGSPTEVAVKLNALQSRAAIPLLVGADLETGAGFRFRAPVSLPGLYDLGGATDFPPLMALGAIGDTALARRMGEITAIEARAVGVHLPFAPVLDVNSNPANPVINVRSFGADPGAVSRLGAAFVRGVHSGGAIATGKHFPGHGDTDVDSHLELPLIRGGRDRFERTELPPFRAAIEAGVGALMTAHIAVPGLVGGEDPATLTPEVVNGILRSELGFNGIVVTDALDMAAVDRAFPRGEAAVRALEAGADILLMPPDVGMAIDAVVHAVESGRIPGSRLDASVLRILRAKEALGLHRTRRVLPEEVASRVGIPAHQAVAREIAERSLVLLRNDRGLLPLRGTRTAEVLSVTYRRPNDLLAGRAFNARLRQTYPRLREEVVGGSTPERDWRDLLERAASADLVLVSLHVTVVTASGRIETPEEVAGFLRELARRQVPHAVVSFGSPYLIQAFPEVRAFLLAWGSTPASQVAAVRMLLGEIPAPGVLPAGIPPLFEAGATVSLPVGR